MNIENKLSRLSSVSLHASMCRGRDATHRNHCLGRARWGRTRRPVGFAHGSLECAMGEMLPSPVLPHIHALEPHVEVARGGSIGARQIEVAAQRECDVSVQ